MPGPIPGALESPHQLYERGTIEAEKETQTVSIEPDALVGPKTGGVKTEIQAI